MNQTIHKTDYLLRPRTECGVRIHGDIKTQECWSRTTCKRCLKHRTKYLSRRGAGIMKTKGAT